ncbi:DNA/RNA nuclease SfsA [Fusibacter ferrireducens]|uniref:Sugar fermentation stimulation protein homolog n=1 Tax=Fusibacter ferrireducens TaxID=2785058 RepID=A0ABR9ZRM2_9FIRM|nr:DNA/RNA nuclease SfsA [Fusibacter ferrireducens]MBF4692976.1 DNA/RNA nuclease SfsA [Fusibacter ferrireducens]
MNSILKFSDPLIQIEGLQKGIFKKRPNRYLSEVEVDGHMELVHVHDPGRLKELLFEDNACLIKPVQSEKRKTKWDMVFARKGDEWILVHSAYHRYLAEALLRRGHEPFGTLKDLRAEVKVGKSRLDFKVQSEAEETVWIEVKGCSLSEDGLAKFPDAPTDRGRRHLEELMTLLSEAAPNTRCAVLILVLSEATAFEPNFETDPKFYHTFYSALESGVEIYPCKILYDHKMQAFTFKGILPIKEKRYE